MECIPKDWGERYSNVWTGVFVENQNRVDRIDILKEVPAKIKFVSFEPLIDNIAFTDEQIKTINWSILG